MKPSMGINKEFFMDLQEKFTKVKKLIDEDSKEDPTTAPFLSKYTARQHLNGMKTILMNLLEKSADEKKTKLTAMLSVVWLHLGIVALDTEEFSTGETELNKTLSLVESHESEPDFVLAALNALNQLGILWSHRDNWVKSKEYLERSQKLFLDFTASGLAPVGYIDLFTDEQTVEEAKLFFEKTHTLTLFYLAQIYSNLKEEFKSALYCHITLKRQLEYKDYDPDDWAINAATLAQFFMMKCGFKQARYHLVAASHILAEHEAEIHAAAEPNETKIENLKHRTADVARCWAKYGIHLLSMSKERLLVDDKELFLSNDLAEICLEPDGTINKNALSDLFFPSIPHTTFEQQFTDDYVLTFEDARQVFRTTQSWLNNALQYYTLEFHATDHVSIIQDLSQLYNHLAFFEEDPERQCKMHKRRIDQLEKIVNEINPNYYLQECRQLWFELGETYSSILEHKMDMVRASTDRLTPHALQKINHLVTKSIENFQKFLDSVNEAKLDDLSKIPDDLEKPVLRAYVLIAILYGNFVSPDKKTQRENSELSLSYYKRVVDYCDKHAVTGDRVPSEIGSCREMVELLPFKILKLSRDLA